ncbi:TonB-dependent receptor plug domain-containing protein [Desulfobacterium sp. N47]
MSVIFLLGFPAAVFCEEVKKGIQSPPVLDEIVVSATKTEEKRKDIANSVIVKDETDINEFAAQSVGELLANEPGIDWQTYGNYGGATQELHIRGMRGNATQVFVNGINVGSPSLGSADVGRIPLNNIERIEVVKGSGSLLYGSGAMGGTVNIITKRPSRDITDLKVSAGYGSQDTYRLSAEQGMFITDDFGYYLTAGRMETDGFRANSYLRQTDTSLKLLLDKSDFIDISLYGDYMYRKYGVPGVEPPSGTQAYYIGGIKFYSDDSSSVLNHSSDKDCHIVLEAKGNPLKWLGYNIKGHYTNMDNYNYERYAFDGTGSENWITNRIAGTDGNINIHPFEGGNLLIGGEYKDFDWKNKSFDLDAAGVKSVKTTTEAHMFTQGAFTEAQYRPSQYLKAIAGVRHENHSVFGSENMPLFGLVINPFETTALKLNHGKHFLAPTFNDLFWPAGPYSRGNPDLKPEIGWHTDIGLEQSLINDKVFISLFYFHWNVDNKIEWQPDSQGVWSPINLEGYKADGVEAGITIGSFYNFKLGLNYTYTDAEEKSRAYTRQDYGWPPFLPPDFRYDIVNRRATNTPEHQFRGDLTYKSNFGLTATATARYVSDKVMYQTETTVYPDTKTVKYTMGSYWTADLKVEQRLYEHWILSLSGNNLFDKDYDTHLSSFTDQSTFESKTTNYPGAGRSVFFNIKYEY